MPQNLSTAVKYLDIISALETLDPISTAQLTYAFERDTRIAYAPFDHTPLSAKLVVVGITPGYSQASVAISSAKKSLASGLDYASALKATKLHASFSGGVMRNNLVAMLDAIGVNSYFDLASTSALFNPETELVHFTSALRYPVFVNNKNYNGAPNMLRTPILRQMIDTFLAEEARLLPDALWLPLGPKPESALNYLVASGLLDKSKILSGLPHPSGANAERVSIFLGRKAPGEASDKTNAPKLLQAFNALRTQMNSLSQKAI